MAISLIEHPCMIAFINWKVANVFLYKLIITSGDIGKHMRKGIKLGRYHKVLN
jgi:hypothetical protein